MITRTPVKTINIPSKKWAAGQSIFGPATVPAGISAFDAGFVSSTWAADTVGLTGSLALEFSTDGGTTWGPAAAITFVGGSNPPPVVGTSCTPGTQVRALLDLSQSVTAAAQINEYA